MADGREAARLEAQMRRRINAPPQNTSAIQALIDHKQATLNLILAKIPDKTTFAELGDLIGYSHEWVRVRLVKNAERLFKIGRRYQIPKGVAEEFVRSVFV
jgi:hypothetical protein